MLENIFDDSTFRSAKPTSCYPNRQYSNGETGALVVFAGRGQDFAISKAGLEQLVYSTRIKNGYVVLAKKSDGSTPEFIASEQAQTMLDRLSAAFASGAWKQGSVAS
jgi:hypothetical protein